MERAQILVVSASDSRKRILEQQFRDLDISCPIHYLEAKILDIEQPDYVSSSATTIERRSILSTRSHIRAVEMAGLDTSPEFSLIVEDDIAIHKTDFTSILTQVIEQYDRLVSPHSGILSLGWIPCNPYSFYQGLGNPIRLNETHTIHLRYTPGTQAYLIKRSKAKEFTPVFKHDSHKALCEAVFANNKHSISTESRVTVFDDFGTKMLEQCILFPPIVIEQVNTSLIRDSVENPYWAQFFKGYEALRTQYWSF